MEVQPLLAQLVYQILPVNTNDATWVYFLRLQNMLVYLAGTWSFSSGSM